MVEECAAVRSYDPANVVVEPCHKLGLRREVVFVEEDELLAFASFLKKRGDVGKEGLLIAHSSAAIRGVSV